MAWFGEGFSSLKGQISNFTKEIVVNNVVGLGSSDNSEIAESSGVPDKQPDDVVNQLKAQCKSQDEEVARLRAENDQLKRQLSPRNRRVSEEATLECEEDVVSGTQLQLVPLDEAGADSFLGQENVPKDVKLEDEVSSLRIRLRKTFQEKVLMEQNCTRLEKEVSLLTRQLAEDRQQAQADLQARRAADSSKGCSQSIQTENCSSTPLSADITSLSHENDQLKQERAQLRVELARMSRAVQDLESQVAVSQDENANLSTGMEELDIQHQEAIEEIMVLKDSTQKRYEVLLSEYEELNKKYGEAFRVIEEKNKKSDSQESASQTSTDDLTSNQSSQTTLDVSEDINNMITTNIPDKYFETSKENASGLETVAALEKMLSHTMARVEASESKVRDLLQELEIRNSDVQEIEEENKVLHLKIQELKEKCDNLPTIVEYCEDIDTLESKVKSLESEISIHREVRSNLEVDLNNSRSEIESLFRQLQTAEAIIKNQDNLQTENSKFRDHEQKLLVKLKSAEDEKEDLLLKINQLQTTIKHHEKTITELKQSNDRIDELLNKNEKLENELEKAQEKEIANSKLLKDLCQETCLRLKLEEEKNKLYAELIELKGLNENNREQSIELEKEQRIRTHLETELCELQKKIFLLEDTNNAHVKTIEEFQNEISLKKQLEESVDLMHGEIKQLEKECENVTHQLEEATQESDVKLKDLKSLNSCLTQKCVKLEKEMLLLSEKTDKLQIEIESKDRKMCEIILEKSVSDQELEKCQVDLNILQTKMSETERGLIKELRDAIASVFSSIPSDCQDFQSLINVLVQCCSLLQEENKYFSSGNESLSSNIKNLMSELNEKSECMIKLSKQVETLQAEKHSLEDRLRNTNDSISIGNQTDEPDGPEISQESFAAMHKQLEEIRVDYRQLEEKYNKLLLSSEQSLDHAHDQLRNLNDERQTLIEAVQTKHTECVNYHAEIQRLCGELTKAENVKIAATEQLEKKLEEKEEQLMALEGSNARQVAGLTEQLATLQHQLDYVSQLLRFTDRQEAEGQPASDPPTAKAQLPKSEVDEKEARKVDELYESLQQEQLRNKYLQDEVSEQHEKEANLARELDRLRSHLVAVEEMYTQEALKAEQQVTEITQRLALAEERAKSSSTAYTSASIRANQQVESLSSQIKMLAEQKEKLEGQLATAEDKLHKQAAALTNLQIVLEQFQRDKERDVAMENERIRQNLDQAASKISELKIEIKALQFQLKEAKEGLSAASRLTEKLDQQTNTISELKQQVSELTEKLKKSEEKIQATSVNVEGKVERCLVRNLLVGYLCAPTSSKLQALGVIASVLDFTPEDRQRSGLDPISSHKQQSLSEAFVRFLENESRPQHLLRLPLQDSEGSRSRKTSFSEVGLAPARRISGSVLKDVLKQDI